MVNFCLPLPYFPKHLHFRKYKNIIKVNLFSHEICNVKEQDFQTELVYSKDFCDVYGYKELFESFSLDNEYYFTF